MKLSGPKYTACQNVLLSLLENDQNYDGQCHKYLVSNRIWKWPQVVFHAWIFGLTPETISFLKIKSLTGVVKEGRYSAKKSLCGWHRDDKKAFYNALLHGKMSTNALFYKMKPVYSILILYEENRHSMSRGSQVVMNQCFDNLDPDQNLNIIPGGIVKVHVMHFLGKKLPNHNVY